MSDRDELLEQAKARLRELEEIGDDELGERVELKPGGHFRGRFRGELKMHTREGESFPVIGLWDADGQRRFHYKNAGLVEEFAEAAPSIGDAIVIVRGDDYEFELGGEQRRKHRYALRTKPSPEPLPGEGQGETGGGEVLF